ncbi:hypothetical protein Bhyg_06695 [Pseudolycoriella hygida]|uniref:Uncharacterized protein n=1 Tax=Pseudolycoriella hygida TaxID=35572 RepID=A0A9Q0S335_9DIPT|nr:hypothetical protein Bhyg_06695 [Pseudolycoriella hygida]
MFSDCEPDKFFETFTKFYSNFTLKMSSFLVMVTLVVLTWWVVRWFLKLMLSLAWLITAVIIAMYIFPKMLEGNLDDILLTFGNVAYKLLGQFVSTATIVAFYITYPNLNIIRC